MSILIRKVQDKIDHARSVQVRTVVFVTGQNVPAEREIDQYEQDSHYFVALSGDKAIGTVRWRLYTNDTAKIERLAVVDEGRGKGIGRALTVAVLEDIKQNSTFQTIKLGAQDQVIPFYQALGFEVIGEGYLDGGTIPHHDMIMTVKR